MPRSRDELFWAAVLLVLMVMVMLASSRILGLRK